MLFTTILVGGGDADPAEVASEIVKNLQTTPKSRKVKVNGDQA